MSKTFPDRTSLLKEATVKKKLRELHDAFVFLEKVANNVAVICKLLYASIIAKELQFPDANYTNTNKTCELIHKDPVSIVNKHKDFQNGIGLDLEEEFRKLPPMHWIPKLHKTPVSERVIIGSMLSSLNPLGKAVTKIFKVIFHFKRRYYKKAGFFSGYKNFWCVDKNSDITDTLDQLKW